MVFPVLLKSGSHSGRFLFKLRDKKLRFSAPLLNRYLLRLLLRCIGSNLHKSLGNKALIYLFIFSSCTFLFFNQNRLEEKNPEELHLRRGVP